MIFARAFVSWPEILVLDEPVSALVEERLQALYRVEINRLLFEHEGEVRTMLVPICRFRQMRKGVRLKIRFLSDSVLRFVSKHGCQPFQ